MQSHQQNSRGVGKDGSQHYCYFTDSDLNLALNLTSTSTARTLISNDIPTPSSSIFTSARFKFPRNLNFASLPRMN